MPSAPRAAFLLFHHLIFQEVGLSMSGISVFVSFLILFAFFLFLSFFAMLRRYRRCPSDRILVIYGKTGEGSAKCIHGGAAFVWPLFQDYAYLDLTPISIEIPLQGALSRENIRISAPSTFTVGIDTEPAVMKNAAERLLGLGLSDVRQVAEDIIFGQFRATIATMNIEEINKDREKFQSAVMESVEVELAKVGLRVINVNIKDIDDESGYIKALGQKAASEAINQARIDVAEQEKKGQTGVALAEKEKNIAISQAGKEQRIGVAEAEKEQSIGVALAEKEQRIGMAAAEAEAVKGENLARQVKADSEAELREKVAEADKRGTVAEKTAQAEAMRIAYEAERAAEAMREERDKATRLADTLPEAEADRRRKVIEAEAYRERLRLEGEGEGERIRGELEGRAAGMKAVFDANAEGVRRLVEAAGGDANAAFLLMMADKVPQIMEAQAKAVSALKIDKVVVWDGNGGSGENGSISKLVKDYATCLPPLQDLLNMTGVTGPGLLGSVDAKSAAVPAAPTRRPGNGKQNAVKGGEGIPS